MPTQKFPVWCTHGINLQQGWAVLVVSRFAWHGCCVQVQYHWCPGSLIASAASLVEWAMPTKWQKLLLRPLALGIRVQLEPSGIPNRQEQANCEGQGRPALLFHRRGGICFDGSWCPFLDLLTAMSMCFLLEGHGSANSFPLFLFSVSCNFRQIKSEF